MIVKTLQDLHLCGCILLCVQTGEIRLSSYKPVLTTDNLYYAAAWKLEVGKRQQSKHSDWNLIRETQSRSQLPFLAVSDTVEQVITLKCIHPSILIDGVSKRSRVFLCTTLCLQRWIFAMYDHLNIIYMALDRSHILSYILRCIIKCMIFNECTQIYEHIFVSGYYYMQGNI